MQMQKLAGLEPASVFYYFEQLCAIPHGSGNTKAISDYLVRFAKEQGLRYIQDNLNNVILFQEGTCGMEDREPVILQGHMDMVCEKDEDCPIDFTTDGLALDRDEEWVFAKGTTLGGDDGIALAFALALLADPSIPHPPLEIIFTVDEETGMDGAKALDGSHLSGRYLLNIDSEEENIVLCGCAGGARVTGTVPVERIVAGGRIVKVTVSGLLGGHSGAEIDKNRTNAVLWLARYLFRLREQVPFLVEEFLGGQKDNAIPRDAAATLLFPEDITGEELEAAQALAEEMTEEIRGGEPEATLSFEPEEYTEELPVMHPRSFEKFLFLLIQAPNGIQVNSAEIPGLVESSLNLGICTMTSDGSMELHWSLRSSKASYLEFLKEKMIYLIGFLGGDYEVSGEYPAWEYKDESKLREVYVTAYVEMFGKRPEVATIHAGLECGLLGEKIPGLDMISIGPEMRDIHTPAERLHIPSAIRIYKLLEKILADGGIA